MDEFGFVDVDRLCRENERLGLVKSLGIKYRFLHWELEFADIFEKNGGFDLVLGNPPWLKVEWKEAGVLGDAEPQFVLRNYSIPKLNDLRDEVIEHFDLKNLYLIEFEVASATQNFLNAFQNYPQLKGSQSNLYKCFLPQAWMLGNKQDISGFLHPEGIYDDPKGDRLRENIYPRLRVHFQFHNELKLFSEVDHHTKFSINIYCNDQIDPDFLHIANLYSPKTVYTCFEHPGHGPVPGIKDDDNQWNVNGHLSRIINVDSVALLLFAKLYDAEGTLTTHAKLPALHTKELINVLRKLANSPNRLESKTGEHISIEMWHETDAVKRDKTLKRATQFPEKERDLILSGPHFFVGNPFYKTPRAKCSLNSHYDPIDLRTLPDNYLPRTNYVPVCEKEQYSIRTPKVLWDKNKKVTDFYRFAVRRRFGANAERSLIGSIVQRRVGHVNPILSTTFKSIEDLLDFSGPCFSIVFDFFIKTTGRSDVYESTLKQLPFLKKQQEIVLRALMLNCVTKMYAALWEDCWTLEFLSEKWGKSDLRLSNDQFKSLTPEWQRNIALRTDYARRQALVEIDVLTSMALGLTLEELKTIYRVQFPVMRQYESDTWYDQNGRIIFTASKGLPGVGFTRPEWNEIKNMESGTVERTIIDDTLPGGPIERTMKYKAPFDRCDREKDYDEVWKEFEIRFKAS
jgi:hypothetical protein